MIPTDKAEHGLLDIYEARFQHLRERAICYLEIGVLEGGSLEWASRYFSHPLTQIVGVDNRLPDSWGDPKIALVQGDQNDVAGLARIGVEQGPFDLVMDDASHLAAQTMNTLTYLWPFVKRGGYYVIEDWGAGYTHHPMYRGTEQIVAGMVTGVERWGLSEVEIIWRGNTSTCIVRRASR